MTVSPLTLPALQRRGAVRMFSCCEGQRGRLQVSRIHVAGPIFNLDTGDVVQVTGAAGAPTIAGAILRAAFPLRVKSPLTLAPLTSRGSEVYVGGYFDVDGLEIVNPRRLQSCLAERRRVEIPVTCCTDHGSTVLGPGTYPYRGRVRCRRRRLRGSWDTVPKVQRSDLRYGVVVFRSTWTT